MRTRRHATPPAIPRVDLHLATPAGVLDVTLVDVTAAAADRIADAVRHVTARWPAQPTPLIHAALVDAVAGIVGTHAAGARIDLGDSTRTLRPGPDGAISRPGRP